MARINLPPGSLSAVDFGAPAAERDIEKGLDEYFVESEAYNRVKAGEKRILIGGRGIGKSAMFQVLARRERDAGSFVIELFPEDYSYELLTQTMASEARGSWAKYGAYAAAWKYLIYVLIMKEVSTRRIQLGKGAGGQIYRYIRDYHANQQASKLAALVSYLKRMEGIKIGRYEASVRARELGKALQARGDQPSAACPEGSRSPPPCDRAGGRTGPRLGFLGGRPGVRGRAIPGLHLG